MKTILRNNINVVQQYFRNIAFVVVLSGTLIFSIFSTICYAQNMSINNISDNFTEFSVFQNKPNPVSEFTIINFYTPTSDLIEFKVFNVLGKLIFKQYIQSELGYNSFEYYPKHLASGIYMYALSGKNGTSTRRMILR